MGRGGAHEKRRGGVEFTRGSRLSASRANPHGQHFMTILVTGAAGFIGYHVSERLLARGEEVIGLDNVNDYYSVALKRDRLAELSRRHNGFRFVEVDFARNDALQDALASESFDSIVHLGA